MSASARVDRWRRRGRDEEFRGRRIHVQRRAGEGAPIVLLHGFPSSSYDWRALMEALEGRALVAFDFLGFGFSEKPRDHVYRLAWQADLAEELVRRHAGGRAFVVAHDMGTSVATELMARELAGEASVEVTGALLFTHDTGGRDGPR